MVRCKNCKYCTKKDGIGFISYTCKHFTSIAKEGDVIEFDYNGLTFRRQIISCNHKTFFVLIGKSDKEKFTAYTEEWDEWDGSEFTIEPRVVNYELLHWTGEKKEFYLLPVRYDFVKKVIRNQSFPAYTNSKGINK